MDSRVVVQELNRLANPAKAAILRRFFKTGKGEYAEGDRFLGIKVPVLRQVAQEHGDLPLAEVRKLLASGIHEHRLVALEILVYRYESAEEEERGPIVDFYLKNRKHIDNWDLVDLSAPYILGDWLIHHTHDRAILYKLARSARLWDRRIAMVSTYALIRAGDCRDTLRLAKLFIADGHDLMHKATGWMLREVGKKSLKDLIGFLDRNAHIMPRTMLRYAIERLPPARRRHYLSV